MVPHWHGEDGENELQCFGSLLVLGLNLLDLAVELMDLISTRGCRSDCRG